MNQVQVKNDKHYWVQLNMLHGIPGFITYINPLNEKERMWCECEVDETRYKVSDNYKIALVPLDKRFESRTYYLTDFRAMLRDGSVVEADGMVKPAKIIEREPISGIAYVEHTYWIMQ